MYGIFEICPKINKSKFSHFSPESRLYELSIKRLFKKCLGETKYTPKKIVKVLEPLWEMDAKWL